VEKLALWEVLVDLFRVGLEDPVTQVREAEVHRLRQSGLAENPV
jgi:hypothetical protein